MQGNSCQDRIRKKGIGGKKSTGVSSTATFVSDETSRANQKSPSFLKTAILDAVPRHPTSNMDTALLTLTTSSTNHYHSIHDDQSAGAAFNPDRFRASAYSPNANCTYHKIKNLPRVRPGLEVNWPLELETALKRLFVSDLYGTSADPPPEYKQIVYLRGPDGVVGVGPHFDYGRIASFLLRLNFEVSAVSGRLVFHAYEAVTKEERGSSNDGDDGNVDSGYELTVPQNLITKVEINRPPGSSMYVIDPGTNGSGVFVDSGDGTGILLKHSFGMAKRDGQRNIFVVDLRYRSMDSLNAALEKIKEGNISISDYLSDEAKVELQEYVDGLSPNETVESAALEVVNRIRATPVSDAVNRCENHQMCGGLAFTYNPNDGPGDDGYVLQRCYECRKEDDLAHPCSGKCGRDSHSASHHHAYCLVCKPGGYTCSGCKERMTHGGARDTHPGAKKCKKCTSDYGSAHYKRKRAEATSTAGREVSTSGRFLEKLPLDHNHIRLVVQAVCQSRPTPTSKVSWDKVMKKLRGWDFPSHFIQQQVKDAWLNKTGKPISVEVYKNSPQARENEEKGDWIAAVCGGCNGEQSMFFCHLANRQKCRRCGKTQMFTRKDETMDSTAGEGNEA